MAYTPEQRQRIIQWLTQRVPRVMEHGCPMCDAPPTAFGVEQIAVPNLEVPLLAIACRMCGYVMMFNETLILGDGTAASH